MDVTTLVIQLAGGVAGSSLVAAGIRHLSLGDVGNVLVGLVGGGLGGQILGSALGTARMTARTGLDAGIVISEIASGALGGVTLLTIVGLLHRTFVK